MIMDVEKFYHLPSVSWKPKKTSGILPVQTWRSENWENHWYKSQSRSEGVRSRRWTSQLKQGGHSPFLCPSCSIQALGGLSDAHPHC